MPMIPAAFRQSRALKFAGGALVALIALDLIAAAVSVYFGAELLRK